MFDVPNPNFIVFLSKEKKNLQNNTFKFVFHIHLSASIIPVPNCGPRIYYLSLLAEPFSPQFLFTVFYLFSKMSIILCLQYCVRQQLISTTSFWNCHLCMRDGNLNLFLYQITRKYQADWQSEGPHAFLGCEEVSCIPTVLIKVHPWDRFHADVMTAKISHRLNKKLSGHMY